MPSIVKFLKKAKKVTLITEYENMPSEHVQSYTTRIKGIETSVLGYYHSIVTQDFLGYNVSEDEIKSKSTPNHIIVNSWWEKKYL